ncbi:hypothetical protein NFA_44310 [Nocardia farcinica IFM 10152]|uniref:Uncharacterized protein n=1 Tax=Nocardia farcinica (strain IFM 10152) TaxID=247156 RepID=Q5YRA9_NOCFA|nr:hypothetical protein NFA_44310 [Nocardia farcinica IFM 10152]
MRSHYRTRRGPATGPHRAQPPTCIGKQTRQLRFGQFVDQLMQFFTAGAREPDSSHHSRLVPPKYDGIPTPATSVSPRRSPVVTAQVTTMTTIAAS